MLVYLAHGRERERDTHTQTQTYTHTDTHTHTHTQTHTDIHAPTIQVPEVSRETLEQWRELSFPDLAAAVMRRFIGADEISDAALTDLVYRSYSRFSSAHVTPLVKVRGYVGVIDQVQPQGGKPV